MKSDNLCTIYLVRHGRTDWNEKGLIHGHTDIPLNSKGEQQAKDLAKELNHIKFDKIYSSDLLRAKTTAEIIAAEHKLTVETSKALRERNYAHLEGKSQSIFKEIDAALALLSEEEKLSFKPHPKIESMKELMGRFLTYLREIAVASSGKNVLVVSHGGPMWMFITLFEKIDKKKPFIRINNLAYIKIESDGVDFFIKETKGIGRAKSS